MWITARRSKCSSGEREVRIPGQLGRRPAVGARALSDREIREKAGLVMNYPKAIKAFYMRVNNDGRTVAAVDVLAPGIGEIIGGSQREERLEVLDRSMTEQGFDREHSPGTATCAATARCRTPASASVSSSPSPTHRPRQRPQANRRHFSTHDQVEAAFCHFDRWSCGSRRARRAILDEAVSPTSSMLPSNATKVTRYRNKIVTAAP